MYFVGFLQEFVASRSSQTEMEQEEVLETAWGCDMVTTQEKPLAL